MFRHFFSRTMKMRGPFAGVLPFNRIEPAANLLREGVLVQFSSEFTVGPGPFRHFFDQRHQIGVQHVVQVGLSARR